MELTCINCNTRLQVDQDAVGKKVRCPNCGALSKISEQMLERDPSSNESDSSAPNAYASGSNQPKRSYVEPERFPSDTSRPSGGVENLARGNSTGSPGWKLNAAISFIAGGLALASLWFCTCVTPMVAAIGLVYGWNAGRFRWKAIGLNMAAMIVSVIWLWFLYG